MLEYKVCSLSYFMDEMETWEARLLCDNIQDTDINGWEQIRALCYFYTLSHVKTGTKVKPTDILKFAWDENKQQIDVKKPVNIQEVDLLMKRAKSREKYHQNS